MLFDFTFRVPFPFRSPWTGADENLVDLRPQVRPRPLLRPGVSFLGMAENFLPSQSLKRRREWQPVEMASPAPPLVQMTKSPHVRDLHLGSSKADPAGPRRDEKVNQRIQDDSGKSIAR